MKLLRRADVPNAPGTLEARRSPARAVAGYALAWVAVAALAWFAWREDAWLFTYVAGFLAIVLFLMRSPVLARLGPANWVARAAPSGLYLHFRSHLNAHFPDEDLTVVFLPYQDIRSAREVRESRTVSYRDAGHRTDREILERRRFIELDLAIDAAPLAEALAAELARKGPRTKHWYGTGSTTYRHYPVRLTSPTTLEVEWHVQPNARAFLEHLGRLVRVEPREARTADLRRTEGLDRPALERRIATLARTGQDMAAVAVARTELGLGLRDAKDLVERLRSDASV